MLHPAKMAYSAWQILRIFFWRYQRSAFFFLWCHYFSYQNRLADAVPVNAAPISTSMPLVVPRFAINPFKSIVMDWPAPSCSCIWQLVHRAGLHTPANPTPALGTTPLGEPDVIFKLVGVEEPHMPLLTSRKILKTAAALTEMITLSKYIDLLALPSGVAPAIT